MFSAISLFCEDIREEKAGTVTVLGILPDNLNLHRKSDESEYPLIPRLAIYTRVAYPTSDPPEALQIVLLQTNGIEVSLSGFSLDAMRGYIKEAQETGKPIVGLVGRSIASPFIVSNDGRMIVEVRSETQKVIAGTMNVRLVRNPAPAIDS